MSSVLVVGATGRLGSKIVRELAALGASVRATHRASSDAEKLQRLRGQGVELVVGELDDEAALERACAGVDAVVSAVQGLEEVIVAGQARLLAAAERAGVRRFLPSDYAIDFFRTPEGGNRNLDLRRAFNRLADQRAVPITSVLGGAFMDLIGFGGIGPDRATGVYRVWGDPEQPYDFTSTDDYARYIAAAALDPDAPRHLRVVGDTHSPREIAAIVGEARGMATRVEIAGTLEDLSRTIEQLRAEDPAPANPFPRWQQLQYTRDMASGLGKLQPLDNARYPDVQPQGIGELVRAAAAAR